MLYIFLQKKNVKKEKIKFLEDSGRYCVLGSIKRKISIFIVFQVFQKIEFEKFFNEILIDKRINYKWNFF